MGIVVDALKAYGTSSGSTPVPVDYTMGINANATNVQFNVGSYYFIGDRLMSIDGHVGFSGVGGPGEVLELSLPSGYQFDTDRLYGGTATANQTRTIVGFGEWFDSGAGFALLRSSYYTATTFVFNNPTQLITLDGLASGDAVKFNIRAWVIPA